MFRIRQEEKKGILNVLSKCALNSRASSVTETIVGSLLVGGPLLPPFNRFFHKEQLELFRAWWFSETFLYFCLFSKLQARF